MSKSTANDSHGIGLLDPPALIRKKLSRATTDSQREITFDPARPGVFNLLTIYQALSGKNRVEIEVQFVDKGYAQLKGDLADLVVATLEPIQARYQQLTSDPAYIDQILAQGVTRLRPLVDATMTRVRCAMGLR
jgi:tryptophanyl-tRNA synthetase